MQDTIDGILKRNGFRKCFFGDDADKIFFLPPAAHFSFPKFKAFILGRVPFQRFFERDVIIIRMNPAAEKFICRLKKR